MKKLSGRNFYNGFFAYILIVVLSLSFVVPHFKCNTLSNIQLTDTQLDFIDSLQKSYGLTGQTAELEDYNSKKAVIRVTDKKGNVKRHLFDLNNEIVLVSNFNGRLNNNPHIAYAEDIETNSNSYFYDDNNQIVTINRKNLHYDFEYDTFNRIIGEYVNNKPIYNIEYDDSGKIKSKLYGNGSRYNYYYANDHVRSKSLNGLTIAEYEYTDDLLTKYSDLITGNTYIYQYNEDGNVSSMISNMGYMVFYTYDENGICSKEYCLNDKHIKCVNNDRGITTDNFSTQVKTDIADRVIARSISFDNLDIQTNYTYLVYEPTSDDLTEDNYEEYYDNITTNNSILAVNDGIFDFRYSYDESNNIISYSYGGYSYKYEYDNYNQLVGCSINDVYHAYSYDDFGNIISKDDTILQYGCNANQDKLMRIDDLSFDYDTIGNPILYKNKNLTWDGTLLSSYDNVTFKYDQSGIRIQQSYDGNTYRYFTEGNKVIYESFGDNVITYFYDGDNIIGFKYNDDSYFYSKDAQNNIIGIIDSNKNLVVEYVYDPWGSIIKIDGLLADSIGRINPYRFRSYRYDESTGLYYLNSRYYDPETCRFISADDIINLTYTVLSDDLSKNLYTYCNNNPTNMTDPNGKMSVWALNFVKTIYSDLKILPDSWLSTPTLVMNGAGIYTAFHETAQLIAAKQLSLMGMLTELEYRTSVGEADILAYKGVNYLYEVKNFNASLTATRKQLQKYTRATGFSAGPMFATRKIDFLPRITMEVSCVEDGIVIYKFFKEYNMRVLFLNKQVKREITENKVKKAIAIGIWSGIAAAGLILTATFAEDIITCGAGVVDDIPSIGVASSMFKGALSIVTLFI